MPVFHKNKLIHIHIPKTAGTAIERYFHRIGDMKWGQESWVGQERKRGRWYEYQHLSMLELRSLSDSEFSDHVAFAVVRDPYTRLISDYLWRRRMQQNHPHSPTLSFDSFDEFLAAIPDDIDRRWSEYIQDVDKKRANFLIHVRPQYQYLFDDERNCLVHKILEYENLDQDLGRFLAPFGLYASNIFSPPIHRIEDHFDFAQANRINEIYATDFELLEFSKIESTSPR